MTRQKILFIGGSLNQTKMAHAVAQHLMADHDCFFTPYYCDAGLLQWASTQGWLDFTVMGGSRCCTAGDTQRRTWQPTTCR